MFIKKIQERIGDKEELEKKLLLILKKVNISSKETAEYMYNILDEWYDIMERDYRNEIYSSYTLGQTLDDIALDPVTFEFNDKEDLRLILKRQKFRDNGCKIFNNELSFREKRSYNLKSKYGQSSLEYIIIHIGEFFLLHHLIKLIEQDINEIEKNPNEYDPNISLCIKHLYDGIKYIFYGMSSFFALYTGGKIEECNIRVSESSYGHYYPGSPGCKYVKRLPGFDTLSDDNRYIKMLRDKKYDELIEILDSIN